MFYHSGVGNVEVRRKICGGDFNNAGMDSSIIFDQTRGLLHVVGRWVNPITRIAHWRRVNR